MHTWPWPHLLASYTALTLAFLRGFENFRYCYQGPSSLQGFHGSFHHLATLKVHVIIICWCCCPGRTGFISTIYFYSGVSMTPRIVRDEYDIFYGIDIFFYYTNSFRTILWEMYLVKTRASRISQAPFPRIIPRAKIGVGFPCGGRWLRALSPRDGGTAECAPGYWRRWRARIDFW